MASKAYIAERERGSRERMHEQDLKEEEKKSKRKFAGDIISSVLSGGAKIGSTILGRGIKQDSAWYKQWIKDVSNFVSLPTYSNSAFLSPYKSSSQFGDSGSIRFIERGPGVVVGLRYMNHLGVEMDQYNTKVFPINEACAATLSQIAKVNSRAVTQDPDILAAYLIIATELASKLAWLKQNIEIAGYFSPVQTEIRNALLLARGVTNPVNFYDNIADWRKMYELLAARFNREVALPGSLSYVKRKVFVNSMIIRDCNVEKSQYYTFQTPQFATITEDLAKIRFTQNVPPTPSSFESWFSLIAKQFAVDQDLTTLIGNIRAGIPANDFVTVPETLNGYVTMIEANDEILMQLHNIKTLPFGLYDASVSNPAWFQAFTEMNSDGEKFTMDHVLDVPASYCGDHESALITARNCAAHARLGEEVLDYYKDKLIDDDYLVGTRLHPTYQIELRDGEGDIVVIDDADHYWLRLFSCGTEIIITALAYAYENNSESYSTSLVQAADSDYSVAQFCTYMPAPSNAGNATNGTAIMNSIAESTNYDWMFPIYVCDYIADVPVGYVYPMCDFANVFSVQRRDLGKVHTLCNKSLYYISQDIFIATRK